ncbi:hypothetical protein DPMN_183043 [Dreissena polymorpha]|uniref:Uncharacterized protein n=1 Tax=Dreissena polymorpha TaxID=45954 RepID=A0A9D4DIC4_DREPO|nr:hypothetical protein DPMN_183043 [Dreissena polymorpha]
MSALTTWNTPRIISGCMLHTDVCAPRKAEIPEVSHFCQKTVHLDLLIPRMLRLKFLISAATCAFFLVSYFVTTLHVRLVVLAPVKMMVFELTASSWTVAFTPGVIRFSQVWDVCCYAVMCFCS